jgi:hypothetical protein
MEVYHGGGIATFMRADIPAWRRFDIECKTLENIVYEVTLDKTKWLIYAIYRPPSMANAIFTNHMNILLAHQNYSTIYTRLVKP